MRTFDTVSLLEIQSEIETTNAVFYHCYAICTLVKMLPRYILRRQYELKFTLC